MPNWGSVLGRLSGRAGGAVVANTVGYAAGGAAQSALQPEIQPIANEAWKSNPTLPTPADVAAQVAIKNPERDAAMRDEAAKQGYGDHAFDAFKSAADVPPGIAELLALHRRGELTEEQVVAGFRSGLLEERWHGAMLALARVLLSPDEAANARQQEFITPQRQREIAAQWGLDPADAEIQYELAGLPPGIGEGIELLRRGKISEERFRQYVHEGHTKTKYEDDLLELRYQPLSASVAAEALIRQRISEAEAVRIAGENGIQRDDFLLWSNMLGRPIATGQALQLARRGEFTYEQFVEAVARSDVRTEYADDLWKLRRVIPNLFSLRALISVGAISDETAIRLATELGYEPDVAHGIVEAAKHAKTSKTRDLAASQVDLLYESGLETEQWALDALQSLGYDADEAQWHLFLLDARRITAALNSHLLLIHRQYVGHKIDKQAAQADLERLDLDPKARDLLFETWDNERAANVAVLTNAEIGQALKYGIFTDDQAVARWIEHGYSPDDARVKAEIVHKGPSHPAGGA